MGNLQKDLGSPDVCYKVDYSHFSHPTGRIFEKKKKILQLASTNIFKKNPGTKVTILLIPLTLFSSFFFRNGSVQIFETSRK